MSIELTQEESEDTARAVAADERHGIVVGIDGGTPADAALAWAASRTGRFGPIRPVHAWDYPLSAFVPSPFGPGAVPPTEQMESAAIDAANACIAKLSGIEHEEAVVCRGDAGVVLVEESKNAEILVVGTRGRGPVRANVIGSVGRYCADHTAVPLVIVPAGAGAASPSERIVVGIDGSEQSIDALRWTAAHAAESAEISAITTWQTPIDGPILYGVNRFDLRALKAAAQATVNEAADKVCAELGLDESRILRKISEGDPRWVLQKLSSESDLLVLGQRGRTGVPHFFLGSTTTALIHRPHCPTAVIPG